MVLALVLSTIDQLPEPEESVLDPRPVMTPLSFKSFPFPPHSSARERFPRRAGSSSRKRENLDQGTNSIPSLRELLLHYFRVQPDNLDLRSHQGVFESLQLSKALRNNVPFYLHYDIEPPTTLKPSRKQVEQRPKVMYLSSASLIVVPLNLLHQWESEIYKHCLDESLNVFVPRDSSELPHPARLASRYDVSIFFTYPFCSELTEVQVVLMSHVRESKIDFLLLHRMAVIDTCFAFPGFSAEAEKNKIDKLHTWKTCSCPAPESEQIPVPKCTCNRHADVSPLLQIRWKRIVIDEGHVSANVTTNLTLLAKSLSVERRWIVSGTPTSTSSLISAELFLSPSETYLKANLMGLNFGEGSQLMYPEPETGAYGYDPEVLHIHHIPRLMFTFYHRLHNPPVLVQQREIGVKRRFGGGRPKIGKISPNLAT